MLVFSCGNPEVKTPENNLPEPLPVKPTTAPKEVILKVISEIKNVPEWIANVENDSKKQNISLDSALYAMALYTATKNAGKYGLVTYTSNQLQAKIDMIKSTPEWFSNIQKEAAEKGKSVDDLLKETATFVLDQELK